MGSDKPRWRALAAAAAVLLALATPALPNASAHEPGHHSHSAAAIPSSLDPAVVVAWNQIAVATLAADTSKLPPEFAPRRPPALTSTEYTRDFNEVKAYGSGTSVARTPTQTATARFFSGNALVQFNAALCDQVTVRHLGIVRAARMFAAIDMTVADTIISVWHAKYLYGFWRPITAINLADTDGTRLPPPNRPGLR